MFIDRNKIVNEETIKKTFELLDKNKSGCISPLEFKENLGINSNYSSRIWETIIKTIDANGDGLIQLDEFMTMMADFLEDNSQK